MEEKIKYLIELLKSDSVYSLLRFGYKRPCDSGMDNCGDNYYLDLFEISKDLRSGNPNILDQAIEYIEKEKQAYAKEMCKEAWNTGLNYACKGKKNHDLPEWLKENFPIK